MSCTYRIQHRNLQVNYSRKYNTGTCLPVHIKFLVLIIEKVAHVACSWTSECFRKLHSLWTFLYGISAAHKKFIFFYTSGTTYPTCV